MKKQYITPAIMAVIVDEDLMVGFIETSEGLSADDSDSKAWGELVLDEEDEEEKIEEQSMDFLPKKFKDVWNDL